MTEPRVTVPAPLKGEAAKPFAAFADYCRMGPARSYGRLIEDYAGRRQSAPVAPPTVRIETVKGWAVKYRWQVRVAEYDAAMQAVADEDAEREMLTGLALPRERVRLLKEIATELTDADGLYGAVIRDKDMLRQLRGLLDDLAKETGGRKTNVDVTSGGKEIAGVVFTAPGHSTNSAEAEPPGL